MTTPSQELFRVDSEVAAHFIASHTLPLAIKRNAADPPSEVISRATFSLLEIAGRHYFVTCAHVHDKFIEVQCAHPNAQLAAYTTIPSFAELYGFSLVDYDSKTLDVAIYRGQEERIALPSRFFIPYEGSYLPDPQIGEMVCIVGYPRENIDVTATQAALDYLQIIFPISSVSDRHVVLADETGGRKLVDLFEPSKDPIDLGGLSGSAAYVLRNAHYRFIGIVKECRQTDQTILISRLGCLGSDGRIDRLRMPF